VNPLRKISLNVKIGALLLLTLSSCLFLSGWLAVLRLRSAAYATAGDTLIKELAVAGLAAERLPVDSSGAVSGATALLERVWGETRLSNQDRLEEITLYQADLAGMAAQPLACWGVSQGRCVPTILTREMRRTADSGLPQRWLGCAEADGRCLVGCVPVTAPAGQHWLLLAQMDTARIDRQVWESERTLIAASLLGLVLASLGAWWVTQRLTRPLLAFASVMQLMRSTGDYSIKIDLHPEDREMSVVEGAFQRLISSVHQSQLELESNYMATLKALVMALDIRDNETAGHSLRVQRYAAVIGEVMRLAPALRQQVETGALLHDIGKLGVPDAILHKNGRLEPQEWEVMRKHPELGRRMVEGIGFLKAATEVVYGHHEHYDGKGYPRGLKGDAIPLAARIFAVADAFDSLTSDRVYRRATGFLEARAEIKACSGTHFDPTVVLAFMHIPDSTLARIRRETMKEAASRQAAETA
jgi:putative nucleotidyltransferase with HDIG domain